MLQVGGNGYCKYGDEGAMCQSTRYSGLAPSPPSTLGTAARAPPVQQECSVPGSLWGQGGVGDLGIPSVPRSLPGQKERHAGSLPHLSLVHMQRSELKEMDAPGRIAITTKITSNQLYV